MKDNAEHWVRCAKYQIKNVEGLNNVIYFTYEDFTENLEEIARRMVEFIPQLRDMKTELSLEANSILGKKPRKIENLNDIKIARLTFGDIVEINEVLDNYHGVMSFWGDKYIQPTDASLSRRVVSYVTVKTSRIRSRLHRIKSMGVHEIFGSLGLKIKQ